jgi:gliding motility-associated-like protein
MKHLLLILISVCTLTARHAHAQTITTQGTEFWLGFMRNYQEVDPTEKLQLFVSSDLATIGTVEVPGASWSQTFSVTPGITTVINVPNTIAEVMANNTLENKGVHVTSVLPISVFAINFADRSADASKILPVQGLGNDYIASSYVGSATYAGEILIVATEDDTEIEIELSAPAIGLDDDDTIIIQMQRGQTYQIFAEVGEDLTGSRITATAASGDCRPFAVFSGANCSNVPASCFYCDHLFEQNLPVNQWGTEYFMAPFQYQNSTGVLQSNQYTYRVIARENNTVVTLNGTVVVNLDAGEFVEYNNVVTSIYISSSAPVAVAQFLQGDDCSADGDPSMLVLDASNQKISSITFSTVESTIITQHYVNIVARTEDVGNVILDGLNISPALFQPFIGSATHRWAALALSEGSHHLSAPQGVNAYIYGVGPAESYAYSVGSSKPDEPATYDGVFCSNNAVTINVSNDYVNPVWYNANDLNTQIFSGYTYQINAPVQTALYQVNAVEAASNCPVELLYTVESLIPPVFTVEPGNTTICSFQDIQFNIIPQTTTATYNYMWSPNAGLNDPTIPNPVASPFSTTTYNVTVSTLTGCASSSQNVTVTVLDGTVSRLNVLADDESICEGSSTQLHALAQEVVWSDNFDPSISWGDWHGILGGTSSTICGAASGAALYFNGGEERSATTKAVNVSNGGTIYFSLKIADGVTPCDNADPGDDVVLRYSFDGINFPVSNTIAQFNEASYSDFTSLEVEIPVAAQSSATYFKWMQVGAWTNNQDNWVLDEMYIGANNTGALNYSWSPPPSLDVVNIVSPNATPTHTTTYTVQVTDALTGCIYSDSVTVSVDGVFEVLVNSPLVKCSAGVITLEANPTVAAAYTYSWSASDGSINNLQQESPVVNPLNDVTFTVTLTAPSGCEQQAEIDVLVSALSSVSVSANDDDLCSGENTAIIANVASGDTDYSASWSSSQPFVPLNGQLEITATPAQTGIYSVLITDNHTGCEKSDSIEINVSDLGTLSVSQEEISECILEGFGIEASVSGTDAVNWQWTPASWVNNPNAAIVVLTSNNNGVLTVTATTNSGCTAQQQINLETQVPDLNLGPDQTLCEGQSANLFTGLSAEFNFLWNTGATDPALVVTTSGTYSVEVLAPNGCEFGDEVTVTFQEVPIVELGLDFSFCEGESAEITAGTNTSYGYQWSTGEDTPTIIVSQGGVYNVFVTNGLCSSTDQIFVFENPLPADPFNPYHVETCFQIPPYAIELDAENEGSIFSWDAGGSSQIFNATEPGLYTVHITSEFGCEASYSTFVEERCPGYIYIPNAFTPDNDGLNDAWLVEGVNIRTFKLELWNRWGELIFTSDSMRKPWLGQRKDGDEYVEPGVYVYKIIYTIDDPSQPISPEYEMMGNVTLIR